MNIICDIFMCIDFASCFFPFLEHYQYMLVGLNGLDSSMICDMHQQ